MNPAEALAFLEDRIRFGMHPGLERMTAMMEALDHPQRTYPVVHVAGTNAKYSVVRMIEAILTELGLTVGRYTSPHLETVHERLAIGGVAIDEQGLADVISYLEPYVVAVESERGEGLTYFELVTVAALEWFFDRAVHVAVLETGLGGEYDATNVADAGVAVITNVTLDHLPQFGEDLRRAAWEKAGIAKASSTVVTGVGDAELLGVVRERAVERGAERVVVMGADLEVLDRRIAVGGQVISVRGLYGDYEEVFCPLFGPHQATNAALAVAAAESFTGGRLVHGAVERAMAGLHLPGRVEVVARHPLVVVDAGHNPAAAAAVVASLQESFTYERMIVVLAMLDDKLVEDVLATWVPVAERFVVSAPASDRAASVERLAEGLRSAGARAVGTAASVPEAVGAALELAGTDDLVVVFGSFVTVGQARAWLRTEGRLAHP